MSRFLRVAIQALWAYKWWWIVPLVMMLVLFGWMVMSQDITGDAPFQYTLF